MKVWEPIFESIFALFSKKSSRKKKVKIYSTFLKRDVLIELYIPVKSAGDYALLILNDGQDGKALRLLDRHDQFGTESQPLLIAAIHAGDRIQEYGTIGKLDYKGRGTKSIAYQSFIVQELLVFLRRNFPISISNTKVGIAGFSLGGLSAISIAWNNPSHFGIVGVFSGALWWRSKPFDPVNPDSNRIIHTMVKKRIESKSSSKSISQRFWFQTGTLDEEEDRNNNGIIDSIDDTLDLIQLLKELLPDEERSLKYVEVENGKHEPETWSKVFLDFLEWGFVFDKKITPTEVGVSPSP